MFHFVCVSYPWCCSLTTLQFWGLTVSGLWIVVGKPLQASKEARVINLVIFWYWFVASCSISLEKSTCLFGTSMVTGFYSFNWSHPTAFGRNRGTDELTSTVCTLIEGSIKSAWTAFDMKMWCIMMKLYILYDIYIYNVIYVNIYIYNVVILIYWFCTCRL